MTTRLKRCLPHHCIYEKIIFVEHQAMFCKVVDKDKMDWKAIKGCLFEREDEQSRLLEAFNRQIEYNAQRELILITGVSGSGKTALATTLQRSSILRRGLFIKGKFDQLHGAKEPYAPFRAAFTEYANLIAAQGHSRLTAVVKALDEGVEKMDASVLLRVIPALNRIMGTPKNDVKLFSVAGADDVERRIAMALCNFIKVICSPEAPLVLLIDDLQWADPSSLKLLQVLAKACDLDGLVLIGTCRNDEVNSSDELVHLLRKLENEMKIPICEIYLQTLKPYQLRRMVTNVLGDLHPSAPTPLADVIYKVTQGNILFAIEFLKSLEEEGCIYKNQTDSLWRYDEKKMLSTKHSKTVQNLIIEKIKGLDPQVQYLLKIAACIGAEFDAEILSVLVDDEEKCTKALKIASRKTLLLECEQEGVYKFAHDRIQQASYSLISDNERGIYHLQIGRRLYREMQEEIDAVIYLVVSQLQQGIHLIQESGERHVVANLCLQAGQKAMKSSDFLMAAHHFEYGLQLITEDDWQEEYLLTLNLHNAAAEVLFCLGNDMKKSESLIESILKNGRSVNDQIRAYMTKVMLQEAQNKVEDALSTGFCVLSKLGHKIPQNIGKYQLIWELMKTKKMLRGKSDSHLCNLKPMVDLNASSAMLVLTIMGFSAGVPDGNVFPLMILRMMQLTLNYGINNASAFAFASYGMLMCSLGKNSLGYRYGKLALKILSQYNGAEWTARVNVVFYGFVCTSNRPLRESIEPLNQAIHVGIKTGDIESAMVSANQYCIRLFFCCPSLAQTEKKVSSVVEQKKSYQQNLWLLFSKLILQTCRNLMGISKSQAVLTGDVMDEDEFLNECIQTKNRRLEVAVCMYSLLLSYTFNDYERAICIAEKASSVKFASFPSYLTLILIFYEGLTYFELAQTRNEQKYIKRGRECLREIKKFSKCNPANGRNKLLLLEAEYAISRGRLDEARSKYLESVACAKSENALHEQALAYERAGLVFSDADKGRKWNDLAKNYMIEARDLYCEWGAKAKVEQMEEKYHFISDNTVD